MNKVGNEADHTTPQAESSAGIPLHLEWSVFALVLVVGVVLLIARPSNRTHYPRDELSRDEALRRINLGAIYLLEGHRGEAEKQYRSLPEGEFSSLRSALLGLLKSCRNMKREAQAFFDEAELEAGKPWIPSLMRSLDETERRNREEAWREGIEELEPEALYLLGLWLAVRGKEEEAKEVLEKSSTEGFHPALTLAALSSIELREGRYVFAAARADELERHGHVEGLLLKSMAELGAGKYEEALNILKNAPWEKPLRPAILNLRGRIYLEEGNDIKAEDMLFRALVMDDVFEPAHLNLAALYTRQDRLVSARHNFDRAGTSGAVSIRIWTIHAELLEKEGDPESAFPLLNRILAREPERHGLRKKIGFHYLEEGDYGKALSSFDRILQEQGDSPSVLKGALAAAEGLDNRRRILSILKRLDALLPRNSEIQLRMIGALGESGRKRDVDDYLREGLEEGSLSTAALLAYLDGTIQGSHKDRTGRIKKIVMQLIQLPEINKESLRRAKDILMKPRPDGRTLWNLSLLRALAGKAVILSGGKDMKAVFMLVNILEKSGKDQEAQEVLRFFIKKYPHNRELKKWLELRSKRNKSEDGSD